MENSFSSLINSSNSILIILPTKPYFDQVAASLGLYLSLKAFGKEASIFCPAPMLVEFNRLVGIDKVSGELGNKNLTIKFAGYKASDIEKVSYDIENEEFRLTVVPKAGFLPPKKEQVTFLYTGISADTLILIGGANESHFPVVFSENLTSAKIIHIGTRALVPGEKSILSFARPSSSVSQIVAELLIESNFQLGPDIATNFLAGIEEGSSEFKGSEVTADTFLTVANLMKNGGQRSVGENLSAATLVPGSSPVEIFQKPEKKEEPPKDWLEPKIFKGSSVS